MKDLLDLICWTPSESDHGTLTGRPRLRRAGVPGRRELPRPQSVQLARQRVDIHVTTLPRRLPAFTDRRCRNRSPDLIS
ncbi:hypothetical protein ACQEVM_16190 [Streptomyces sp. CA-243310]|uniref:hypothetical protein n=1 Tax=Streptomyces sp. CA-243310 TaxID=3240056 RepID=UPI003D9165CA